MKSLENAILTLAREMREDRIAKNKRHEDLKALAKELFTKWTVLELKKNAK